jgi:hypothetical protein
MRARFAYISSLGTTAILVAAALLMLALVSAIVAFRGWPGQASDSPVQSVPLAPSDAPTRVALVRRSATARGVERSGVRAASARGGASTAGLVKAAASGPRVVPGLVMQPEAAAPMSPEPSGPGRTPQSQQVPAAPAPEPQAPASPEEGGPVPGAGGGLPSLPPIPQPAAGAPNASPSADQVTAMVGTLLSGGTPPPPVITGITRVADGVLALR